MEINYIGGLKLGGLILHRGTQILQTSKYLENTSPPIILHRRTKSLGTNIRGTKSRGIKSRGTKSRGNNIRGTESLGDCPTISTIRGLILGRLKVGGLKVGD